MEFETLLTGLGGQGIQLAAKTLALAATNHGRHAMLAAEYGGEMRGGPSQATVVVGDRPLRALPILPSSASAILFHHKHATWVLERTRPGGLVLVNSSVVAPALPGDGFQVVAVPATQTAADIGAPQAGGFVLLGAFNQLTGLVPHELLGQAMAELLPPYRRQHVGSNERALTAGAEAVADRAGSAAPTFAEPVP